MPRRGAVLAGALVVLALVAVAYFGGLLSVTGEPLQSVQFSYRGATTGISSTVYFQVASVGCHQSPTLYCSLNWTWGDGTTQAVSTYYGDPQQTFPHDFTMGSHTVTLTASQGSRTTSPASVTFAMAPSGPVPPSGTSSTGTVSSSAAQPPPCQTNCAPTPPSSTSLVLPIQVGLVAAGAAIAGFMLYTGRYRMAFIGVMVAALALLVPYLVR